MKTDAPTSGTDRHANWKIAFVVIVSLFLLYYIKISGFPLVAKILFAVALLIVSGMLIKVIWKIKNSFYGLSMISTQKGISFIDRLSKAHPKFWIAFADWGLAMSFGLLSYFIFKKQINKRTLALGIITNIFLFIVVYPQLQNTLSFINIPQITGAAAQSAQAAAVSQSSFNFLGFTEIGLVLFIVLMVGGFSMFIFGEIAYIGLLSIFQIGLAVISSFSAHPNYSSLSGVVPGIAPIIPGIDIPLIGGILALLVAVVFHEFSHGVLGRISKLKLKSIGGLIFGVIPIGAFVELDEKALVKLKKQEQNRIFIAGITSNIFLTIVFFFLFVLFVAYIVPYITSTHIIISAVAPNSPASHYLSPGITLLKFNNVTINNVSDLVAAGATEKPLTNVSLVTSDGNYSIRTNSTGKIGIGYSITTQTNPGIADAVLYILYTFVSLAFLLNFLVGILNLLPLPLFDGWRIYKIMIKNEKYVRILAWFMVLMLIVLALPWLWLG